jgi:hypothetical protein
LFRDKPLTHYLGFRKEGFLESLVLSSAFYALYMLLLAIIAYFVLRMDPFDQFLSSAFMCSVPLWFSRVDPLFLPVAAILFWLILGIVSLAFLQSFPINALSRASKKITIPLISILFIMLYNMPLLTWEWKLDDIIFLGILFPLILYKYGNSLGLVLSYTFLYEMPVRVAFLRGWGENAFWILVLM